MMDAPLRVLHVVPSLDETYGGPATAVPCLAMALEVLNCASFFFSVAPLGRAAVNPLMAPHAGRWVEARPVPVLTVGRPAMRAVSTMEGLISAERIDLIHLHGLWSHLAWAVRIILRRRRLPLLLSPRSDLMAQGRGRSPTLKALAARLYADDLLARCDGIHATDPVEAEAIAAIAPRKPRLLAPNGIVPGLGDDLPEPDAARHALGLPIGRPVLLFLSRLDPRKNPDLLLEAAISAGLFRLGWVLVFAGAAEDPRLARRILTRAASEGVGASVFLLGHVGWPRNRLCFAAATVFALPTHFENFGNSIAEALACGVPVVTTPETPWRLLPALGAGFVGPPTLAVWTRLLQEATTTSPDRLAAMGAAGRDLVRRFDWRETARLTAAFYRDLARSAPSRP